ncbi:MAG: ABC transporter ATP-binding protein [Chitinophagales bacterium]|jgi:putative ABC transport system ATP-binding protein|nr:ABC transporter ATP-binding protein [Chitinophagales bacterium]
MEIARLEGAGKVYKSGDAEVVALQPTDFKVDKGELVLIIGPSGSGKTTLLSLLGCVIYPSQGKVWINGTYTNDLSDVQMANIRLNNIGFVFQSFNLIAPLNVEENVMLPLTLQGIAKKEALPRVLKALDLLGMTHRLKSLPKMLSGGEQQRVAIARALVSDPPMLLCDEPTASLDVKSVGVVMKQLQDLAKLGKSVIVVTHDQRLVPYATRVVEVQNGAALEVSQSEYLKNLTKEMKV